MAPDLSEVPTQSRLGDPYLENTGTHENSYAFIDAHVRNALGNSQQQTAKLARELENLHVEIRKKIDNCLEAAEGSALALSRAVPEALSSVNTLGEDTKDCHAAAQRLLTSLEARGAHQQEGLGTLYVLHAVKKHFEGCSRIVAELHRWHFRVQEAELLLQSLRPSGLLEASQQRAVVEAAAVSASLRHAASLLASLPEFETRLQVAKKLEQRVLSLCTLLLQDAIAANSTEGFGCAVAAFESLGAQEVLIRQLPAALKALLVKEWGTLWAQTPTGRAEETEEGQLSPDGSARDSGSPKPYHPTTRCIAEPEALIAYAERWTSAVEQTAGFIRAAAASVGSARRQSVSGGDGNAASSGKPGASRKALSGSGPRNSFEASQQFVPSNLPEGDGHWRQKNRGLWVSLLLASMGAGADVPLESLERLLQRYRQQQQQQQQPLQGQDGLEVAEQLLEAYEVAATLVSATPAFAETETTEPQLWQRLCSSVQFLPPSLLAIYGAAVSHRFSAMLDPQPQTAGKRLSPAQAVTQMEGETHVAVERLLEVVPAVCGKGNKAALTPFILAAADAALVETLNALSPRINTFHQSVAIKSQNLLMQQKDRLSESPFERVPLDLSLFSSCLQLHCLMASISGTLQEVGDVLKQHLLPVSGRHNKLSLCIKALLERPGFQLEMPPLPAVLAAQQALARCRGAPNTEDLLPLSYGTHAALIAASQDLVVSCCCTPIELFLQSCYGNALAAAAAAATAASSATGSNGGVCYMGSEGPQGVGTLSPTAAITAVGEHVLSLLPLLEDSTPPADQGFSWVSLILQSLAGCYARVLLKCIQQGEEAEANLQPTNGSAKSPLGLTSTSAQQHRSGGDRSPQPPQKALPCALTDAGLQVVLNDLSCLQRLAETLGVNEETAQKGGTGALGFAYMFRELAGILHQAEDTEPTLAQEPCGEARAGSTTAAAALAAEVVSTAKRIFRCRGRAQ